MSQTSISKLANPSNPNKIFQLAESWKQSLNTIITQSDQLCNKTQETLVNLYKSETRLLNTVSSLEQICNHHNHLDSILQKIIERQNKIVEELDLIQEKMIEMAETEGSGPSETSEEVYEKYKRIEKNKKELDDMMANVNRCFNARPPVGKSLDLQVEYLNYLQSNVVKII